MTESFVISFDINFTEEGIVYFLEKFYKEFRDEYFKPLKFNFFGKEKVGIDTANFKKLEPHIKEMKSKGVETYIIELNNDMIFLCFTKKKYEDTNYVYIPHGFLSIYHRYFWDDTKKWNNMQANKKLPDIIQLCLALIKAANANVTIFGWEEHEPSPYAHQIDLLVIKKQLYKEFLKAHVKIKFNIKLEDALIDKLVRENAYSFEEKDGFIIINFSAIRKPNKFYEAVRNLTGNEKS